mgnify:FL=1
MVFLHPAFTLLFIFLFFASLLELFQYKKKTPVFTIIAGVVLILLAGFRYYVGADYPAYKNLFVGFSIYTDYSDVFNKAIFKKSAEEIEWIFVLINKIIFDLGMPFYIVTLVMAIITISLKLSTIYKFSPLPALSTLFYFMPVFFFEDSGQMRQGVGIAICVFSFRYIVERNLMMFLLCIYLALGFHKTSIVFLPAFWLVKIPMNSKRILWALVICLLLSPLEPYKLFGEMFTSLLPQDVSGGYDAYVNDSQFGGDLEYGITDIVKIFFIITLLIFEKEGSKKIAYFEYMRNLAVFGLCMYYLFRGTRIFAIRLPGVYMFFLTMFVIPSLIYAVEDRVKKVLISGYLLYLTLMYFNFAKSNGNAGNFTPKAYRNVLWK